MADFKQIDEARKLLGLDNTATLKEIKTAYHNLALMHHPDKNKDKNSEKMFKKIGWAYELLMTYCAGYTYSFREKEVKKGKINKEFYEHLKRFYDGWWENLEI